MFLGRGEHHDISGSNVEHPTYMTDADTNSLDIVDSDTRLHLQDEIQHDILSVGSFYKVFFYGFLVSIPYKLVVYTFICNLLGLSWGNKNWWFIITLFYSV